jgi:hypothetical protein
VKSRRSTAVEVFLVKLILALLVFLAAMPAAGRERLSLHPPADAPTAADDASESQARPSAPAWRATQVNRCADANGRVKLQDVPCSPAAASAAEAVADVVELSSLKPRALADAAPAAARETATNSLASGLFTGAWKLGLIALVCYAIFRLIRAWRDWYRLAPPTDESTGYGSRRVK